MTEYEKMLAGEPFSVRDPEVYASKLHAVEGCQKLNSIPITDEKRKEMAIRELFGSCGKEPQVLPTFTCDNGKNIHVGDYFLANYNVTILDGAAFTAGDRSTTLPPWLNESPFFQFPITFPSFSFTLSPTTSSIAFELFH